MELKAEDISRVIQWLNAVKDLNPAYLQPDDFVLEKKLKDAYEREAPQIINKKPEFKDYLYSMDLTKSLKAFQIQAENK